MSSTSDFDQRLTEALRERGLRVTSQRIVINRVLHELYEHVTADEMLEAVEERLPGVSLPTVYATLELLEDLGLVRRVHTPGTLLFDPRPDNHAHALCRECGRVDDLDARAPADATLGAA